MVSFVDSDGTLPQDALMNLLKGTQVVDTNIVVGYLNEVPISEKIVLSADDYSRESIKGSSRVITGLLGKLYHRSLLADDSILMLPRNIVQGEDMIINVRLSFCNKKDVVLIPLSVYNYNTEKAMSCMHTFVPTLEYMERFYDLLSECIPNVSSGLYTKEILISKLRSLHYITRKSGNIEWKKSLFYEQIKTDLNKIDLTYMDYFLLKMPRVYSFAYRVFRFLFR